MEGIYITADSTAQELEPIAKAIYGIVGLPVTMRSKNKKGIRIENNTVIDTEYTGEYLENTLKTGKITNGFAKSGPYMNMPVIVSPIKNKDGETIAAVGVVNLSGFIDLKRF